MSILDILAKQGVIETKDLSSIREKSESTGESFDKILLSIGVSEDDILKAKGEYYAVPVKKVNPSLVTSQLLEYISEEAATYYQFVPIGLNDGILEVGMVDPDNIAAKDALNFISSKINLPFKIFIISENDFDQVINLYKGLSSEVTKVLTELETEFVTEPGNKDEVWMVIEAPNETEVLRTGGNWDSDVNQLLSPVPGALEDLVTGLSSSFGAKISQGNQQAHK